MKPLLAKQKYLLNRRLIIFSLVFVFFTFITALLHQLSMWSVLPQYTFVPNWLFYPLIFSFFITFIDMVIWFGILLILEVLGIVAMVYAFSFTGLYSFSWVSLENPILQSSMSISLLIIDVVWYFDLYPPIHALLTRTYWTSPEDRARKKYEKKFKSKEEEPGNETAEREPVMIHTKEELARLLNLWQQKYAQATTEEGRKLANEKIREYQTELEKLKAKSGTTPEERAKLTQGGDNE
ncbi:hypothetical protein [Cuniculiplasma divulgatum]|nr:hypothetical protein [Cuniculiplasma divulgatum]